MSTAKFDTLQNAAGSVSVPVNTVVNGSAKAWVSFNGTSTVAIRTSFNVSSITDNGTGDYTVNYTTAFANANYTAIRTGLYINNEGISIGSNTITTTTMRVFAKEPGIGISDLSEISVICFL